MYRYSKAAESPSCVYVKMRLKSNDKSVEMHFLYDSKCKSIKYSKDGLKCHETIMTDFKEHINMKKLFTDKPTPFKVFNEPCYYFYVKSGNKKRRIKFERGRWDNHMPYKWLVNLFEEICREEIMKIPLPVAPPMNGESIEIKKEPVEYLTGLELIKAAKSIDDDEDVEFYVSFNDKDGFPIKKPEDAFSFNIAMYSKKTGERLNECYGARLSKKVDNNDNKPEKLK